MDKKILIVDDDPFILEVTSMFMEKKGFKIISTTDPENALAIAQREHPDLIISDIAMPGMDGVALLNGLRGDSTTKNIPLVFLTGADKAEDIDVGLSAGADVYLLKPVDWMEAWSRVEPLLSRCPTP